MEKTFEITGIIFSSLFMLFIYNIPSITLVLMGYRFKDKKPKTSKILYIIAMIYVVVELCVWGALMCVLILYTRLEDYFLFLVPLIFIPLIILTINGFILLKNNKALSKQFYILAITFLIIGLGVCGSLTF